MAPSPRVSRRRVAIDPIFPDRVALFPSVQPQPRPPPSSAPDPSGVGFAVGSGVGFAGGGSGVGLGGGGSGFVGAESNVFVMQ